MLSKTFSLVLNWILLNGGDFRSVMMRYCQTNFISINHVSRNMPLSSVILSGRRHLHATSLESETQTPFIHHFIPHLLLHERLHGLYRLLFVDSSTEISTLLPSVKVTIVYQTKIFTSGQCKLQLPTISPVLISFQRRLLRHC